MSQRRPDAGALRQRARELAAERRRFGYRRFGYLLAQEGLIPSSHDADSRGESQSDETLTRWLLAEGHGHGRSDWIEG